MIVYITCKDKKEAQKIAEYMINKKLAACVNYFPISSTYSWEGQDCKCKRMGFISQKFK